MNTNPFEVCLEPKCNEPELPSTKDMAKGFINTAFDVLGGVVRGEGLLVTEDVYNTRISICNSCEFFRKEDKRCSQCACCMETKTKFKQTSCPVHKWGAE